MRNWGVHLVLFILLAGCGATKDASSPSSTISAKPPVAITSPGSILDPIPSSNPVVGEVHFLDPAFGWAPVSESCGTHICLVVYETHDGGANWTPRTNPPLVIDYGDEPWMRPSPAVRLATKQVGWLLDEKGALYTTDDGAVTWRKERADTVIIELQAQADSVWRLDKMCSQPKKTCHYNLVTSNDQGRNWHTTQPAPPIGLSGVSLVRPSPQTAYILSDRGDMHLDTWKPNPIIARTMDGGKTWTTLTPPCSGYNDGSEHETPGSGGWDLAASTPNDLWLVCRDGAASGAMQRKHLFRSSDGGNTWSKDLGTPNAGSGGHTVAASPSRACRGGNRTSISCTRDGGRTWFYPIPGGADNPDDGGVDIYQFIDDRHGWAIGQDKDSGNITALWRTSDGGESWSVGHVGSIR
jgi:photosystem II stability/assembly factor-like uncharacterized protein